MFIHSQLNLRSDLGWLATLAVCNIALPFAEMRVAKEIEHAPGHRPALR